MTRACYISMRCKTLITLVLLSQLIISKSFIQNHRFSSPNKIERSYRYDEDDNSIESTKLSTKLSEKLLATFKLKYKEKRKINNVTNDFFPSTFSKALLYENNKLNIHELRNLLFNKKLKLESVIKESYTPKSDIQETLNHEVIKLISMRYHSKSKPGRRVDSAKLALSIEGGGMRGAVSAGMAAAIATLGLCDTFDCIYGSSAGSVIGAYMVSRQLCIDVYTDLLVAAKETFVSKMRIFNSLIYSLISTNFMVKPSSSLEDMESTAGMNISFVLDGILSSETGLRPLDRKAFEMNDKVQPLHIVSSVVRENTTSVLDTICYNSKDGDFSNRTMSVKSDMVQRYGLFACLQASMCVPGAAGPPVQILREEDGGNMIHHSFDAFCFEPIPYRSAVKDGATHVLVLRSRPDGSTIKTKPGVYEKTIAPLYFKQNKLDSVGEYFKQGGQQFRYLEDFMTLEEGFSSTDGVLIPPTDVIYGAPEEKDEFIDSSTWKKAHLLPIIVPGSKPELPTLEQGQDEVLNAVRDGFAAAFDLLAPIVINDLEEVANSLNTTSGLTIGDRVAELLFPRKDIENVLLDPVHVKGEVIHDEDDSFDLQHISGGDQVQQHSIFIDREQHSANSCSRRDAHTLLSCLPGLRSGRLSHLADGLHWHIRSQ